jgi:hypothetical protein
MLVLCHKRVGDTRRHVGRWCYGAKIRNTFLSVSFHVNVGKTKFLRQNSYEGGCSNKEIGLLKASTACEYLVLHSKTK